MARVTLEVGGRQFPVEVIPCYASRDCPPFVDHYACARCPLLRQFAEFAYIEHDKDHPPEIISRIFIEDHMSQNNQEGGWQGGLYIEGRPQQDWSPIRLRGPEECVACHQSGMPMPYSDGASFTFRKGYEGGTVYTAIEK